nr:class I SAM-dependent methyltransferase [Methylobacterium brachythecii]
MRDEKYYEVAPPSSLAERIVAAARDRIHADFLRLCRPRPESTILDVGVSDVLNDAANVLERTYPHRANITAVGLGSAEAFREAYPEIAYRQVSDDCRLPFADDSFDAAVSNAVLEHVGSRRNQQLMLAEMCRVARSVFVTVPHRFFPIEHHTAVPFLHFTDAGFRLACRLLGKADWTREENLILMTRARLAQAVPAGRVAKIGHTGLPLGPFSSNLYLHIA